MSSGPEHREKQPTDATDPQKILDTIHDGFFLIDIDNDEIIDANRQACELLGYDRAELLSLSVSDIHPDEMERFRQFASAAESEEQALASDLHCLRKDGRKIPIEASACVVESNDCPTLAVIVRDISTIERQNHYFKVFERVLRHNLRNRMNVVLNRAELIEANVTDEFLAEQSGILCRTVDKIIENIEDIRTVQKILQNEVDPSWELDCTTVIDEIKARIEEQYPAATLTTALPGSLDVRADDSLTTALEHIIENAVVHNEKKHPNVEIMATPVEEHGFVEIQVIDDGPGLPPAERYVVENPEKNTPLEHGTGLGLWIASMIVFTLDGDILIQRNEPEGTVVKLQLPQASSSR